MGTRRRHRSSFRISHLLCLATLLASSGCVYRLQPVQFQSQQRLRIVTASPGTFTIHTGFLHPKDYRVPSDGKVTLDVPAYRRSCGPYLLGIEVGRSKDTFTSKTIEISGVGRRVQKFSLKELERLPADSEGYRMLEIR